MNFISILGVILLLVIAWLLSYHKTEIKLRPVFWGIGLQLIFALIILREDYLSFIGMSIFCFLILLFIHWEKVESNNKYMLIFFILITSILIGYIFSLIPSILPYMFLLLMILLFIGCASKSNLIELDKDFLHPAEYNVTKNQTLAMGDIEYDEEQDSIIVKDIQAKITSSIFKAEKFDLVARNNL